jgi:hypothetical protein
MVLYDELVARGCQLDNHESDLYVKCSEEAINILDQYPAEKKIAKFFRSQIDGTLWIDVPFSYLPWWRARAAS